MKNLCFGLSETLRKASWTFLLSKTLTFTEFPVEFPVGNSFQKNGFPTVFLVSRKASNLAPCPNGWSCCHTKRTRPASFWYDTGSGHQGLFRVAQSLSPIMQKFLSKLRSHLDKCFCCIRDLTFIIGGGGTGSKFLKSRFFFRRAPPPRGAGYLVGPPQFVVKF